MYSPRLIYSLINPSHLLKRSSSLPSSFLSSSLVRACHETSNTFPKAVLCRQYHVRGGTPRPPVKKVLTKTKTTTQVPSQKQSAVAAPVNEPQYPSSTYQGQGEAVYDGRLAGDHVNQSVSLQQFLKRSMLATATAVGASSLATAMFMQMPIVVAHPYICLGVGLVGSIGGLMGMGAIQPTYTVDKNGVMKAEDSPARLALFGGLLVGQGLALAPLLFKISAVAPTAIPVAAALAVGTMAGMGAYALKQPQGAMLKWGPTLYVGLFGLIGTGLLNIFIGSSTLSLVNAGVGILVFSGFTAYDTHVAIQNHNEGRPDHLSTAASFYMNFVNLFLDYLRLIQGWFSD